MKLIKIKKLSNEEQENIELVIESEGFWYALTDGGYIKPEEILENKEDIDKINEAIQILQTFETILTNFDIINE